MSEGSWVQSPVWPSFLFNRDYGRSHSSVVVETTKSISRYGSRSLPQSNETWLAQASHLMPVGQQSTCHRSAFVWFSFVKWHLRHCWLHFKSEMLNFIQTSLVYLFQKSMVHLTHISVKQKRWPDWGLNPGPSRHIPDALTTELSGQIN